MSHERLCLYSIYETLNSQWAIYNIIIIIVIIMYSKYGPLLSNFDCVSRLEITGEKVWPYSLFLFCFCFLFFCFCYFLCLEYETTYNSLHSNIMCDRRYLINWCRGFPFTYNWKLVRNLCTLWNIYIHSLRLKSSWVRYFCHDSNTMWFIIYMLHNECLSFISINNKKQVIIW